MYSASTALLEALTEGGVSYLFANFGSDHPAIVESIAEGRAKGRKIPTIVTCPNEMVALAAAQGYAQASGRAQAVLVHVDCGTQALAGAIHNVARARTPVLIFAGASPATQEGEHPGSRNEFIHWIQDVFDQRGIVRGYVKYENEVRSGRNMKQIVHRALQIAASDPKGPVYLMAPREVLEQKVPPTVIDLAGWRPIQPMALPEEGVEAVADALIKAERPLVVTSYLGRSAEAVAELVRLADHLAVAVHESAPSHMNFPADNPMYQGNQWNQQRQNRALGEADFVLTIDSDVPWIPLVNKPSDKATIFHIDIDPLKQQMPLWYIEAERVYRADSALALKQINERLASMMVDKRKVARRRAQLLKLNEARQAELERLEQANGSGLTPEYVTACVRRHIDEDAIVLNEGITNYGVVVDHMRRTRPGTHFTSGGSSLGWHGGAAIGAKLAQPDRLVAALTGDGSYMFSIPSTVHWMARQYSTPFLQVIYNNRGWKAPKFSALAQHPDGYASRANEIGVSFDPPPDYSQIAAAAGGAHAVMVKQVDELEPALGRAVEVVKKEKRCAVLDVWLPHL